MKKFTEDEMVIINYTLKSLLSVVRQEIKKIPDGSEVTQEVITVQIIENLLEIIWYFK